MNNKNETKKSGLINMRISEELKEESAKLFKELGIDMSTAITLFLVQCVKGNGVVINITNGKNILDEKDIA